MHRLLWLLWKKENKIKRSWSISSLLTKYQENMFTSVKMTMKYAKKIKITHGLYSCSQYAKKQHWICFAYTSDTAHYLFMCRGIKKTVCWYFCLFFFFLFCFFICRCRAGGDQVSPQPHAVHRHQEMHSFQQAVQRCSRLRGRLRRGRSLSR